MTEVSRKVQYTCTNCANTETEPMELCPACAWSQGWIIRYVDITPADS